MGKENKAVRAAVSIARRDAERSANTTGRLAQREVSELKRQVVAGSGKKGLQAVKDYASVAGGSERVRMGQSNARVKMDNKLQSRAYDAVDRSISAPGISRFTRMGKLLRAGVKGMLSPAGVAEGVALEVSGRTAKPAREKMQERGVQKVEKNAPKTAAAMRKARVTKA